MKTYTILIADDYPENLNIIVEALEEIEMPHKIMQATNGQILCELAEKWLPDLIITDWEMPKMDGIEAIKYLKNLESTKHIPIIMCTGIMTSSESLKIALEMGAIDYIRKPIDHIELQARVHSALKLVESYGIIKQQNEELEQQNEELEQQKDELQTINEELTVSNEKLYNQTEELAETIDKLHIAQEQLLQSEKMASLGVLAAGIAHEINNPLNFIQGGIFCLENYFNESFNDRLEEVSPIINGLHEGVSRVEAIVNSLTTYSQHNNFQRNECDIHSIIDNCLIMLTNQIKNSIEIRKNYTQYPFILICNESKLHQVFLNILSNAVHAISDRGIITISTSLDHGKLLISIKDTGCGILKENMHKIFDPFFTTKDTGMGKGLGLSIAYNIIHEHNGSMKFESKAEKGTEAIIKLPINNS